MPLPAFLQEQVQALAPGLVFCGRVPNPPAFADVSEAVAEETKSRIGFTPLVKVVELGVLPRSEKKTKRVFDERYE